MTPHLETLEAVDQSIDEARAKIVATRESLQAALDAQEAPNGEMAALVARLGRMAVEVERVQNTIAEKIAPVLLRSVSS